jgi:hypothetical protein
MLVSVCSLHIQAQTKQDVFNDLEKILKRAEGQKVRGSNVPDKVTKQLFNESSVSVYTKSTAKKSTEYLQHYSDIPWNELYKYTIYTDSENEKVYEVTIYFEKDLKRKSFFKEEKDDGNADETILIKTYILTKDFADFDKYMNLLGQVIPNKVR